MIELLHRSALLHIRSLRFLRAQFDAHQESAGELLNVVDPLTHFIWCRGETIILLVKEKQMWDADILSRVMWEATLKLFFICCDNPAERKKRIDEYRKDIAEVNELRTSDRSKRILQEMDTPQWHEVLDPLLLPDEEEKTLRAKWNKNARTRLEQRWSYSEIVAALARESADRGMRDAGSVRLMLHSYANASYFIHADERALNVVWDRVTRPAEERSKLEMAHATRLLGDALLSLIGIWPEFAHVVGAKADNGFRELQQELAELLREFQKVSEAFWQTQRSGEYPTVPPAEEVG